jgi:predicted nucleic acid-binding protein
MTDVMVMELLAGAPSAAGATRLRARVHAFPILRAEAIADYEEAAAVYRTCRDAGRTVRGHIDCLVAVVTIRERASLLHNDRDFDVIARHTTLKVHAARG